MEPWQFRGVHTVQNEQEMVGQPKNGEVGTTASLVLAAWGYRTGCSAAWQNVQGRGLVCLSPVLYECE